MSRRSAWQSFATDLLAPRWMFVVMVALAYVWQLVLYFLSERFLPQAVVLAAWAPLLLAPVWAVAAPIVMMRRAVRDAGSESWSTAAAWGRIVLNLAAVLVQVLCFTLLVAAGALLLFSRLLSVADLVEILPVPALDWLYAFAAQNFALLCTVVLLLASATQIAFVFGQFGERFRTLLGLWVFLIVSWGAIRLVPLVAGWFQVLPDFRFEEIFMGDAVTFETVLVDSSPFIGVLIFIVALSFAAGYVLSRVQAHRSQLGAGEAA